MHRPTGGRRSPPERPRWLAPCPPVSPTCGQAKNASASSRGAPRNIHISAMRSPSNRYTNALRDSRAVAVATQRGVFPLGGPPVGAEAELLVELDLAVGGFEPRSDDAEQPSDTCVVARHRIRAAEMEHEVVGEDLGQGVVVLVEDRFRHAVDGLDVGMVAHWSSRTLSAADLATVRNASVRAHRANR